MHPDHHRRRIGIGPGAGVAAPRGPTRLNRNPQKVAA